MKAKKSVREGEELFEEREAEQHRCRLQGKGNLISLNVFRCGESLCVCCMVTFSMHWARCAGEWKFQKTAV